MNAIEQARMRLQQQQKNNNSEVEEPRIEIMPDEPADNNESLSSGSPSGSSSAESSSSGASEFYRNVCMFFSGRLVETRILTEIYNGLGATGLHARDSASQEGIVDSILSILKSKEHITQFITHFDAFRIEDLARLIENTPVSLQFEMLTRETPEIISVILEGLPARERIIVHYAEPNTTFATQLFKLLDRGSSLFAQESVYNALQANDAFRTNLFALWNFETPFTSSSDFTKTRVLQLSDLTEIDVPLKYYRLGKVSQFSTMNLSRVSETTLAMDYNNSDVVDFLSFIKTAQENAKENSFKNYLVFYRNYGTKQTLVVGLVDSPNFSKFVNFMEVTYSVKVPFVEQKNKSMLFECTVPFVQDEFLRVFNAQINEEQKE